jgi:hypothetical protein
MDNNNMVKEGKNKGDFDGFHYVQLDMLVLVHLVWMAALTSIIIDGKLGNPT